MTPEPFRNDYVEYRYRHLESIGIKTIRFNNEDIFSNINEVLGIIIEELKQRL